MEPELRSNKLLYIVFWTNTVKSQRNMRDKKKAFIFNASQKFGYTF